MEATPVTNVEIPADDAVMRLGDRPVNTQAFPFIVINPDKMPALLAAFAEAQGEYPAILRDKLVSQKLRDPETKQYTGQVIEFYYAELAQILAAVLPCLSKRGISLSQPLHQGPEGTFLYTILAHKDGCMFITKIGLQESKDIKQFGGQITFLRRYMAAPAVGVSAEDDADNHPEVGGGGDDDGQTYGGRSGPPQQQRAPQRAAPQRRSAAAASPATPAGGIDAGKLKNLQMKVKAAGLDEDTVKTMLERLGVPEISAAMTEEHWKKVKAEVEHFATGGKA